MTALEYPTLNVAKPKLWVPGDWNAFFGFGTNILVNLLTLTGLMIGVLGMPSEIVFKRILPATGLMLFLSTVYYAYLAYRLARRTGRNDVCALPSGISVPHMFVVTFVVMLPIKLTTGDPIKAWEAGLTWVFIQSFVLMVGGFAGPIIRKVTPRAALLGTLAGVSITFISMRPAIEMFLTPVLGFVCFAVILLSWFGGVTYRGIPAGLVAIALGIVIAWTSNLVGLGYGDMSFAKLQSSVANFGLSLPTLALDHTFGGFAVIGTILVTAVPFGIYDLVEALDNVESAEVAGDSFPTTRVLTADGFVSLIGCLMGNPFINAVYIGHPGWKAMGGRVGYSALTGVTVLVLTWLGIVGVIMAIVPVVAISPILLYIGMLIGSQAFQETPRRHAPAIILALVPHLAAWAHTMLTNTLAAAGIFKVTPELAKSMAGNGVFYEGLGVLGRGSILSGVILAAVGVFIIDRRFVRAAAFAGAGAVFTFFGLMHNEHIGLPSNGLIAAVAVSYAVVAVGLYVCSRLTVPTPVPADGHGHGHAKPDTQFETGPEGAAHILEGGIAMGR